MTSRPTLPGFSETTTWSYLQNASTQASNGWLASQLLPNGALTTYSYNGKGLLARQQNYQFTGTGLLTQYAGDGHPTFDLQYDTADNLQRTVGTGIFHAWKVSPKRTYC